MTKVDEKKLEKLPLGMAMALMAVSAIIFDKLWKPLFVLGLIVLAIGFGAGWIAQEVLR